MALSSDGARPIPSQTVVIAAGKSSDTTIKAAPGALGSILITAAGTTAVSVFDNASGHTGTVLGLTPATTTAATVYVFNMPAANGMTIQGNAGNPGMTVSYW